MASSQPLSGSGRTKGQAAMLCELCENNPKLKWKCLDCELLMCERCKDKVHQKIASAQDHIIIDIKEVGKHQTDFKPKLDLAKINCEVHNGKCCCLFCKTCQILVCQTCIADTHNKHEFGEISDEYETKVEKVEIKRSNIEIEMQKLIVNEKKLNHIKSTEQSNYHKVKQEIRDHGKALVNEIKKHTDNLLKELDEKWETFSNKVNEEDKILNNQRKQIHEELQKVTNLLQPRNCKNIFSFSDSLPKSAETKGPPIDILLQGVPTFTNGDSTITKIPLELGKLEDVFIPYTAEPKTKNVFVVPEFQCITSVTSCPGNFLWICDNGTETVRKVKPNRDNLNVISNLTLDFYEAAIFPSGDLLLSADGSSNLKLIPSSSANIQDSMYTVSPIQPTGIHVTRDNKVIVGARRDESVFPNDEPSQVMVMDQNGHHEKIFQYDRHNKPLFTYPRKITSSSKSNIAVIDWVSGDQRGRVVIICHGRDGEVINIYTGHPDVNNEDNPFKPAGITTTPLDNFVVADTKSHNLHILNSEGEYITCYNTKAIGILLPYSLCFSTTGKLYIGCNTYVESNEQEAKLFTVDNFLY